MADAPSTTLSTSLALEAYRGDVVKHLQQVGAPVLLAQLGSHVPRPEALKSGRGKIGIAMRDILLGDARFQINGEHPTETLSLAGAAGVGAALSSREQQPSGGTQPALEAYRLDVVAHLQQVGAPVLLAQLGSHVPRPAALKSGPDKIGTRDILVGDARFQINGEHPSETLSLVGTAVEAHGRCKAAALAAKPGGAAGAGAALSSREQPPSGSAQGPTGIVEEQPNACADPALEAYRDEVAAYLQRVGAPVLVAQLFKDVSRRTTALKSGAGKIAMRDILAEDARFQINGLHPTQTLSLAGPAVEANGRRNAAALAAKISGAAGAGAALSSREQQPSGGTQPALEAYRLGVVAHLQQVGASVLLAQLGGHVLRPAALNSGPDRIGTRDALAGDARFQISGEHPTEMLSLAGPAGIVEEQPHVCTNPALEVYRVEVAAYLQRVGAPVLLTKLGTDVPRPAASKVGPEKKSMRDILAEDSRFRIGGLQGSETLSLAGPAGIVCLLFAVCVHLCRLCRSSGV